MKRHDEIRPLLLIAERDPFMRDALKRALEERFDLEFVDDGVTVLERAKARSPDLIILEVLLPMMDGFQVCRQLKSDPATRHIPVLFFTLLLAEERAAQAGGDGFLLKPLRQEALLEMIDRLLAQAKEELHGEDSNSCSQSR